MTKALSPQEPRGTGLYMALGVDQYERPQWARVVSVCAWQRIRGHANTHSSCTLYRLPGAADYRTTIELAFEFSFSVPRQEGTFQPRMCPAFFTLLEQVCHCLLLLPEARKVQGYSSRMPGTPPLFVLGRPTWALGYGQPGCDSSVCTSQPCTRDQYLPGATLLNASFARRSWTQAQRQ